MFKLRILILEHGWADLEITIGGQSLLVSFEHTPNDVLADIVLGSIQLVTYLDTLSVCLPYGSQWEYLYMKRIDSTRCQVSFRSHSQQLTMKQYARAVLRMFDSYTYARSVQEYIKGWGHVFPQRELEILRSNYRIL